MVIIVLYSEFDSTFSEEIWGAVYHSVARRDGTKKSTEGHARIRGRYGTTFRSAHDIWRRGRDQIGKNRSEVARISILRCGGVRTV